MLNFITLDSFYKNDIDKDWLLFLSLIDLLLDQFEKFQSLEISKNKIIDLSKLTHKIKSGARSFGADIVTNDLEVLEELIKKGDFSLISSQLLKVKENIQLTKVELLKFKKMKNYPEGMS
jgi:hypothetical protein